MQNNIPVLHLILSHSRRSYRVYLAERDRIKHS